MTSNEGKVCDGVVRILEQRTGKMRTDICRPEKDRVGPPVDLRLKLGGQQYAIEHTKIEAFEKQIETGWSFSQLIKPIEVALSGELPGPAAYTLCFPVHTSLGVTKAKLASAQSQLADWVLEKAQSLHMGILERLPRPATRRDLHDCIKERPPGFKYEIALHCHVPSSPSGQEAGTLRTVRSAPDDENLEALRVERLRRALSEKCRERPNLQCCKEEDGARTVLVLEDNDIALSEQSLIGTALAGLLKELSGKLKFPDEIYLVDTSIDPLWQVWPMKYDDKCRPVDDWAGWNYTEFHVDELTDLTKGIM